jgi:hypothetical protein
MWGTFLTGGFATFLGALFLFLAIGTLIQDKTAAIDQSEARFLYILIYLSIASTLAAIAVWLASAVMLLFFLGAQKLGILEDDNK